MNKVLEYLTQQSTWKGLISLVTAAGVAISPDQGAAIIATGMALVGLVNVFRNESK